MSRLATINGRVSIFQEIAVDKLSIRQKLDTRIYNVDCHNGTVAYTRKPFTNYETTFYSYVGFSPEYPCPNDNFGKLIC